MVVTQNVTCTIDSTWADWCGGSSGAGLSVLPAGSLVLNGGFESDLANWTNILPSMSTGIKTNVVYQATKSIGQGQTALDANGYCGGFYQPVTGLQAGDTATVSWALWSDGRAASGVGFSAFLGSIRLQPDPYVFQDQKWDYITCANVPATSNSANIQFQFLQIPQYWYIDAISVVMPN